jgi:hypothetical protein
MQQEQVFNKSQKLNPFKEGDLVWYFTPQTKKGLTAKLLHPWQGSFRIKAVRGPLNVEIQSVKNLSRPVEVVHITKLKPYREPFDLENKVGPSGIIKATKVKWGTEGTKVEDDNGTTLDLEEFEQEMDLDEDGQQEFEVEDILQQRRRKGQNQYLVKWVGYKDPTWESEDKLEHLDALKEFKAANRPYYSLRRVNRD